MSFKNIVAGTDGSDTSLQALKVAARLASLNDATLTLVFAHTDDRSADQVFEKARAAVGDEVKVETRSEKGDPADVLIRVAEDVGADLMVLGNKGMTGISRFALGSVPNKVSHHSPCDLMIVRTT